MAKAGQTTPHQRHGLLLSDSFKFKPRSYLRLFGVDFRRLCFGGSKKGDQSQEQTLAPRKR